jgi:predicted DNA binding CopG/RHH family protein
MNKKTIYSKAPDTISEEIRSGEKIDDFLPPPDQLVKRNPKIKITITLNSRSVDFFKKYAKKNNVKYQTMINEVLDQYAQKYNEYSSDVRE